MPCTALQPTSKPSQPRVFVLQCYYYGDALTYFKRHRTTRPLYAFKIANENSDHTPRSCWACRSTAIEPQPFDKLRANGRVKKVPSELRPFCFDFSWQHFGGASNPFPSPPLACHTASYLSPSQFGLWCDRFYSAYQVALRCSPHVPLCQ